MAERTGELHSHFPNILGFNLSKFKFEFFKILHGGGPEWLEADFDHHHHHNHNLNNNNQQQQQQQQQQADEELRPEEEEGQEAAAPEAEEEVW